LDLAPGRLLKNSGQRMKPDKRKLKTNNASTSIWTPEQPLRAAGVSPRRRGRSSGNAPA